MDKSGLVFNIQKQLGRKRIIFAKLCCGRFLFITYILNYKIDCSSAELISNIENLNLLIKKKKLKKKHHTQNKMRVDDKKLCSFKAQKQKNLLYIYTFAIKLMIHELA